VGIRGPGSGFDHRSLREIVGDHEPELRTAEHDVQYSRGDLATRVAAVLLVVAVVAIVWVFMHGAHAAAP
jgi:hypothetical protein